MRIFLAGSTGAIGVPLVRALVAAGHDVTALTRSRSKVDMLRALGAVPAVADALDAEALHRAVLAARPSHVIHQLTALPKGRPAPRQRARAEQPAADRRDTKSAGGSPCGRRAAVRWRIVRALPGCRR
jgi:nucleoside-diphosphate-sugar epimerase